MSLVVLIIFDHFYKKMIERFNKYNINYIQVHFEDLDTFLNSNHEPVKVFFIMGSTRRILRDGIYPSIDRILKMPIPIIGICYGFQYLAMRSGGVLEDGGETSMDNANMETVVDLGGEIVKMKIWVSHHDKVLKLPTKKVGANAAIKAIWSIDLMMDNMIYMAHTDKWIGYQFHPEFKKKSFDEFILPFVK
jgi:GMP synthase-like glutamine amidotransferase